MTKRMQVLLISVPFLLSIAILEAQSADIYCDEPLDVEYASVTDITDEDYSLGTEVTYVCQFGYVATGNSRTVICVRSGSNADWTEPQFSCIPQSCGDPGYVNNGRRIGSRFTFPNSVKYECNAGYKLRGLATRYCQTGGSWSGRLPTCEVVACKPPKNPNNGQVITTSLEYGSDLQYKCDVGFQLNFKETVFCTANGTWSKTDIDCIESVCDIPEKPEYGSMLLSGAGRPRADSIVIFSCEGGRIAYGSTTSKCLHTGQWTFPPPQCLMPCSIPHISNGVIGKYVREGYRRYKVFKEKQVGGKIEDDEELVLLCNKNYEVMGSESQEMHVICNRGKWFDEPFCEPASCRSSPPPVQNGEVVDINRDHGGTVSYRCFANFKKVSYETVICDFGTWKGTPPVCKTTKCSIEALSFPGLLKGRKSTYNDGEVFEVECNSRYRIAQGNGRIRCEEGTWFGTFPPCIAASCKDPPPEINYGRAEGFSTYHSSVAKYVCEELYVLQEKSRVVCSFGNWEGQPPICVDSRCYINDLKNLAHVSSATPSVTVSGLTLNVACDDGYSPKSRLPICVNGTWNEDYESPCRESLCSIPKLSYGDFRGQILGDWEWSWRKFRYQRKLEYIQIPIGKMLSPGSHLWLFCYERTSVRGSGRDRAIIQCSKGKWSPEPVCVPAGFTYIPPTVTTHNMRLTTSNIEPDHSIATTKTTAIPRTTRFSQMTTTIQSEETSEIAPTSTFSIDTPSDECYCEYLIQDENLVAHADGKRLKFGDKVRDGSTVVFRCLHVGYHRFNGQHENTCNNCPTWNSMNFPSCTEPSKGNTVIISDTSVKISMEGNIELRRGQSANLTCIGMEVANYPTWSVPTKNGISITNEYAEREVYEDILFLSRLRIENADYENEGSYGCTVENNPVTKIRVIVIDPNIRCPKFTEYDEIVIEYDVERHEGSKASFSCPQKGQELVGNATLTCLRSGEWSGFRPYCTGIRCKQLKEDNLLKISYTKDREIGSLATFHCFVPGKRSGASFATCLENGTWSDPTPTCVRPPCSVDQLSLLANTQNFQLVMDASNNDTVPYNGTIKITCADNMVAKGNPVAKCGKEGLWKIDEMQCFSGCLPIRKSSSSKLIVVREKEEYSIGERLEFSCPPGMSLNTDFQVIMCLKSGWSDTTPPECEENRDYWPDDDLTDFEDGFTS